MRRMIWKSHFHVLYLGLWLLMVSCVPKPSSQQVKYNTNTLGKLVLVESEQLGVMPVGEVQTIRLTLKNEGKLKVSFSPMELPVHEKVQFVGDGFPGLGGSCQKDLDPGETCTLMIQAFSSTIDSFSEPFIINYLNGIGETTLTGHFKGYFGTPARLDLSLEVGGQVIVDFGLVEPGVTKNAVVEIENKGNLPAESFLSFFDSVEPIFHYHGGTYPGVNGTCKNTLAAGEKCYLDIAVTPTTPGQESKGSLKVNYSNPISSKTFSLNLKVFSAEIKAYLAIHEKYQLIPVALNQGPDDGLPRVTWTVENVGLAPASAISLSAGDMPFVFESSTCPEFLEPGEICTLTYKLNPQYELPLPDGLSFPINYNEVPIQFSFLDSKNPMPVLSEEAFINGKIIDEALLVINKNGNNSTPFPYDPNSVLGSAIWARDEWFGVIGDAVVNKTITIVNPGPTARTKATNITFEIIPNDGDLVLACLPNCPVNLNPGSSINTTLTFKPTYQIPYSSEKDYVLKMTYHTGRRTKTYELTIQTKSKAIPLVEARLGDENLPTGSNISLGSILPGHPLTRTFQITNRGPSDFYPDVNLNGPSEYFQISSNTCAGISIKNNQTCSVTLRFLKNEYGPDSDVYTHSLSFDNGLEPSSPDYASFNFSINAKLVQPGEISVNETFLEFVTLPWSVPGYVFTREDNESIKITKDSDTWDVSKMNVELTGPDAEHFEIVPQFALDYPTGGFKAGNIKVLFIAPQGSGGPRVFEARIKIFYYGGWREEFVSFDPLNFKQVELYATVQDAPYVRITDATLDYGPLAEGEVEYGFVKIKNIGQAQGRVTTEMPKDTAYKIIGIDENSDCQQISINPATNSLILDISSQAECTVNISFTAKPGTQDEIFKVSNVGGNPFSDSKKITGRGLNLAHISISPGTTNSTAFHEFSDVRMGQSVEKTFTLSHSVSEAAAAELISVGLIPYGSGDCSTTTNIPNRWKNKAVVSGDNIDFTIIENTCAPSQSMNTGDSCSVKIKFQPQSLDKLIGACLKVAFKPFPNATPEQYSKTVLRIGGMGLAPLAIFKGWTGIFAEGATDSTPYKVKLRWKPMEVEENLGTVIGYNVYRSEAPLTYPSVPLNTSLITTSSDGQFEFIDSQVEDTEDYSIPLEGDVVYYTIKPVISISGYPEQVLTEATEGDRFTRVIIPFNNTVLLHRRTVNILTCMNMLDKGYADLDRAKDYSCTYNGFGSTGGIFDAGKDRIIDRYENSLHGTEPSNAGGELPYLYSSLEAAKESCTKQKGTISDLAIIDRPKRLMNRQDYMIASFNQKRAGCIDDSPSLESSGRGTCFSEFNIEDLIGNAWEFIDAELVNATKSSLKWKYSTSVGIGENRDWIFDIPLLVLDELNISNPLTFSTRKTYSETDTKCMNSIFGLPFPDIAGTCLSGNILFSNMSSKMDVDPEKNYIFMLGNFNQILENMEGKRYMMAGGAYNSKSRIGIDINRYSIYWTEPTIETIFYSSSPVGPWEGGAARCVLDVSY